MSAAQRTLRRLTLSRESEPGVCRFRVFYLSINGRRSVVPEWRLRDTLHPLKLATLGAAIERLEEGATLDLAVRVHRRPLNVFAHAGAWEVRSGAIRN